MSSSEVISKTNSNNQVATFDCKAAAITSTAASETASTSASASAVATSRKVSQCEKIEEFEYKGYYKFGNILGKGSFGTVIECVRKSDEQPVALKFFKLKAIHHWYPESLVSDYMNRDMLTKSEYFSRTVTPVSDDVCDDASSVTSDERLLPSEVACLLRAHTIPGIVRILDYIPADVEYDTESSSSSSSSSSSESNIKNDDGELILP